MVKAAHGHLVVLPGFMEVMAFAYAVLRVLLQGSFAPLTLCVGVPWCSQVWVPDLQWSKTATRWRALVPALSLPVQEHALGKTSASPAACVWCSWACRTYTWSRYPPSDRSILLPKSAREPRCCRHSTLL